MNNQNYKESNKNRGSKWWKDKKMEIYKRSRKISESHSSGRWRNSA